MRLAPTMLLTALAALLLGACGPRNQPSAPPATPSSGQAAAPSEAPPRGLKRNDLPALVRDLLRGRMDRHADAMESLLLSSISLEYELIAQRADWVADEPRIARPQSAEDRDLVNQVLPDRFFDLQDELHRQAVALGDAARRHDDEGIASAYGGLAGTCIRCHGLYRRLPGADKSAALDEEEAAQAAVHPGGR